MLTVNFTLDDAQAAGDEWGFNCGPGALCAVLGMTPADIRPHLRDFESKQYTNPTLMFDILRGLNVDFTRTFSSAKEPVSDTVRWPPFGLVRIQWGGPWTREGVPMRARYRATHWIGYEHHDGGDRMVFDINALPGSS